MLTALLTAAALAVAVLMVRQHLAEEWSRFRMERALRLDPDNARALGRLSRQLARDKKTLPRAAEIARHMLWADPLDPSALRILSDDAYRRQDQTASDRYLDAAAKMGWRDPDTMLALMDRAFRRDDYALGFTLADGLFRTEPQAPQDMMGSLVGKAEKPGAIPGVIQTLARPAPWRAAFFKRASNGHHDPTLTQILFALGRTRHPPTSDELSQALVPMTDRKDYVLAYRIWRQVGPDRGLYRDGLADGEFRHAAGTRPFAWAFGDGVGYHGEASPEGALLASYDGYSSGAVLVQQLVVLAPGDYQFSIEASAKSGESERLRWQLTCANDNDPIMSFAFVGRPDARWSPASAEVTVPAEHCPAQWLRLVGDPGDRRSDVEVWYRGARFTSGAGGPKTK